MPTRLETTARITSHKHLTADRTTTCTGVSHSWFYVLTRQKHWDFTLEEGFHFYTDDRAFILFPCALVWLCSWHWYVHLGPHYICFRFCCTTGLYLDFDTLHKTCSTNGAFWNMRKLYMKTQVDAMALYKSWHAFSSRWSSSSTTNGGRLIGTCLVPSIHLFDLSISAMQSLMNKALFFSGRSSVINVHPGMSIESLMEHIMSNNDLIRSSSSCLHLSTSSRSIQSLTCKQTSVTWSIFTWYQSQFHLLLKCIRTIGSIIIPLIRFQSRNKFRMWHYVWTNP